MARERLLKIDEVEFDWELYPRMNVNWLTALKYADAMKTGADFPPIVIGMYRGKRYVIDGWHRVEALKLLDESYVKAVVKPFGTWTDMFVEAVKLNITHGRAISPWEKARIIHKLKGLKFTLEQITEIVRVPVDKIERFAAKVVIGPDGKPLYLKSPVAKASAITGVDPSKVDQSCLNVRSVQHLLTQLITLLEADLCPLEAGDVKERAVRLYSLLKEKLKL